MTIKEAIEKAVSAGYKVPAFPKGMVEEVYFLDPLFWQSLGKSLGWKDPKYGTCQCMQGESCEFCNRGNTMWEYHWHRFIDHLAEGKSIESFFEPIN